MLALANPLDVPRLHLSRDRQTGGVKLPHRRFVDRSSTSHAGNGAMDRLKSITLVFAIRRHGISPLVRQAAIPLRCRRLSSWHTRQQEYENPSIHAHRYWTDPAWRRDKHRPNTGHLW